MQFTKTFITLACVASALAAPTLGSRGGSGGGSGGGSSSGAQCCQNVSNWNDVDSATKGIIFALIGVVISDLNVPIGTGCTPIDILGGVSWYVLTSIHPFVVTNQITSNTNTVTCGQVFAREFTLHLPYRLRCLIVFSAQLIGINCVPVTANV
jgi:hypothetical protein